MRSDGSAQRSSPRVGVRRELAVLYGVAVLALIVVVVGAFLASRSVAEKQALQDAERMTTRMSKSVVGPLLADALRSQPPNLAEVDKVVHNRIADGYLTEVTVWDRTGRVVYADEAHLIGEVVDVPTEVLAAIDLNTVSSAFEDHPEAEVGEPVGTVPERFVEVYVPISLNGQKLAFEAYYDYETVQQLSDYLLRQIAPLVIVPLIILQLVQLPIGASLARRLRRHETERAKLLERTLSISDHERMRIAADLHDGPIQDLAGVGYAIGAISPGVPAHHQPLVTTVQETLYSAIQSLRVLMVDLYPPDLTSSQLPDIIRGLASPLQAHGVEVRATIEPPPPDLDLDVTTTLYRVARETLSNVGEHAQATRVTIDLRSVKDGSEGPAKSICLRIADDGTGIDPSRVDRRAEGHLGLRLLHDRVANLRGSMLIAPQASGGTVVQVTLPLA